MYGRLYPTRPHPYSPESWDEEAGWEQGAKPSQQSHSGHAAQLLGSDLAPRWAAGQRIGYAHGHLFMAVVAQRLP